MTADELKRLRDQWGVFAAVGITRHEQMVLIKQIPRLLDEIERLQKIEAAARLANDRHVKSLGKLPFDHHPSCGHFLYPSKCDCPRGLADALALKEPK